MGRWPATAVTAFSVVLGLSAALVAQVATPAASPNPQNTRLRGFVITLVLGEIQGSSSGTFTPAEAKALADLKGFLPYKAYRPLDTAWVIGLNGPHLLLRGVDGQKHEFYMYSTQVSPTFMSVDLLRLWDAAPADPRSATAVLIDATFKIHVDETVVVGTSRLDGGRALILLVTAAPIQASGSEGSAGSR
jgi:hypothetical protein